MHFVDWRRGVCVLQMVMALGLGLEAPSVSACSPPYPGQRFFTLDESIPADGATDVLPDGLIRVARRSWVVPGTVETGSDWLRHDVTVIDLETGAEVKGSLRSTEWADSELQYWKPDSRLLPNRRYALLQTLTQGASRPDAAQGPTQTRTSFSTGNRQVPALTVLGGLDARLESYEASLCESGPPRGPCGGCGTAVPESRHGVWIQVPAIQGGFTFGAYRVEIVATSDTPYDFSAPASAERPVLLRENLSSHGDRTVSFLELPLKASAAARVCVAWRAFDSLGSVREGASVCVDAAASGPGKEPPGPKRLDDLPGYLGFGCSLGGAGAAPAALGLLALLIRGRRRTAGPTAPRAARCAGARRGT